MDQIEVIGVKFLCFMAKTVMYLWPVRVSCIFSGTFSSAQRAGLREMKRQEGAGLNKQQGSVHAGAQLPYPREQRRILFLFRNRGCPLCCIVLAWKMENAPNKGKIHQNKTCSNFKWQPFTLGKEPVPSGRSMEQVWDGWACQGHRGFLNPDNTMKHFEVFEQNLLLSPLLSDGKASGLSIGVSVKKCEFVLKRYLLWNPVGRRNLLLKGNRGCLEEPALQTFFNTQFSVEFLAFTGFWLYTRVMEKMWYRLWHFQVK